MMTFDVSDFEVIIEKDGNTVVLDKSEFKELAIGFFCQDLDSDIVNVFGDMGKYVEVPVGCHCSSCGAFIDDHSRLDILDFIEAVDTTHLKLSRS